MANPTVTERISAGEPRAAPRRTAAGTDRATAVGTASGSEVAGVGAACQVRD